MNNDKVASTEARQVRVTLSDFPEGQVATVTICNACRLNTMNSAMMGDFIGEMGTLAANEKLRAVVLTGDGEKAFIGGADIKEMAALHDPAGAGAFISRVHACLAAVRDLPVPTIARIQGYAFGAGLEMAAACDLRVASDNAVFGMPEVGSASPRSPKPRCCRCWSVGDAPGKCCCWVRISLPLRRCNGNSSSR
jgi:enoyl-CoA hydratase/carnithine racemase